ncbi:MAG TPA: LPXTG cell wall anchor domain-containing protein [Candidatus Limivicinus faecipullorum]|nr:LPXTG cell wall anchor domain-containing protein [Candidatus Limivicinus faecipullorum]
MRHFIKQCIAISLCLVMALSLFGAAGYASNAEAQCSCTVKCESGAPNPDCPVCSAQGADLSLCAGVQPEAQCSCTVKCESGNPNPDCPVCSAQGADLSLCAGTQPEAQCSCTVKCESGALNPDCPVCSAQGADLSLCAGTQPEGTSDPVSISSWAWVGDENLTEGKLYLPGLNSLDQESFESVKPLLPSAIKVEGLEETLELSWAFENLKAGSNENEFTLSASLPQGYILAEEAQPLSLLLVLGGAQSLELKKLIYVSTVGDDANDGSEDAPVASFPAALSKLAAGGTICLASDMTVTDTLTIPQGTEFTLDLSDKTLTLTGSGARRICNYGVLTVIASNGGCVTNSDTGSYGFIDNYGTLNIESGNFIDIASGDGATIKNRPGGTLNISGGYFEGVSTADQTTGNTRVASDGTLNITGGSFYTKSSRNPSIKVISGTAYISNADIQTQRGVGIEVNEATATLDRNQISVLESNGYYASAVAACYGGSVDINSGSYDSAGYGVYIFSSGGTLVVKDGEISGGDGAVRADVDSSSYPLAKALVRVEGGSTKGPWSTNGNPEADLIVSGGVHSADITSYLEKGFEAEKTDSGFAVKEIPAVQVGSNSYGTLERALAAAVAGDSLKLLQDLTIDTAVTIDKNITLDLNGHGVTGGIAGALINIASGANVSITDTSGSPGRIYNGGAATSRAVQMEEGAALTLNGGITLETGSVTSIARSCTPLYITASDANPANVNIINANLVSPSDYAIRLSKSQNAIISIQGGSFSAPSKADNVSCIYNGSAAQVSISGGSFTNWAANDGSLVSSASSILVYDDRVCVQAAAPDSYTARLEGLNCYLTGSELYSLTQRWDLNGNTLSVRGALSCSYPSGKYFGNVNGAALSTAIELESGASLSGSMPLAIADVKVSGGSAPADFFQPYNENYEVSVSSQDGGTLYSSRIKSEKILAYVIRDGVSYEYTDVSQAINNAKKYAGSTLKLNADYSTGSRIYPGSSDAFDWTLDLNGHSYTYTSSISAFQISGSGKSFTVADSSANGGGQLIISRDDANSAIETNKSSSGCHITIGQGVTVTGNSILILGTDNTVDVYGSIVTGNSNAAIQNNGGSTENSTVNLHSGAVVESNSIGVFLPGSGTLNVYGGAQVKGGNTGIELRAGTLNIYDGASVTGGSGTPSSSPNDSGSTTSNAAVAIAQHNTGEAIDVNIYGGSFTGGAAFYESNPQGNDQDALDKIAVEITGGSFIGSVSSQTRTGFISGGTYSQDPNDNYIVSGLDGAAFNGKFIIVAKGTTPLNIEGVSAVNRDCDGTSVVQLTGGRLVDGSGSAPANVGFELGTGAMADKYAGTGKPVTTAIKLTGTDAAKYTLIQPSNITVTITCKPVHVELKPATCVSDGVQEHYYCANCELYYTDAAASSPVAPAQLTIPATGTHTGDGKWYADSANHWHKCSVCGQELDKAAHQLRLVNYKRPSIFSKGYTGDRVCSVCGYVAQKGHYFTSTSSPITGDESNLLLWGGLLILATAGIGGLAVYALKRKKKN